MFHILLRAGVTLALAFTALVFAPAASAQTVVTLTGETLSANPLLSSAQVDCGTTLSTVTFDAFGTASPPYSGPFEEHGTVTFHNGVIESFSASFRIEALDGTIVTGTKELNQAEAETGATCGPVNDIPEFAQVPITATYDAMVSGGPLEPHSETGRTNVSLTVSESATGVTSFGMAEIFQSGGPPGTTIEVSPVTAVNPTGTLHTVTATVRNATAQPVQGITVSWVVSGGSPQTSQCTTDANGTCDFFYVGPDTPSADEITACADTNASGTQDPLTEPCAAATKAWSPATAAPGGAHGGGYIRGDEVVFGFSGQAISPTDPPNGGCSVIDRIRDIHIRCLDVATLVIAGTHATLTGTAEQDGIATNYTIDVDDLTALGQSDIFKIVTAEGYEAIGTLTGGQIVVQP